MGDNIFQNDKSKENIVAHVSKKLIRTYIENDRIIKVYQSAYAYGALTEDEEEEKWDH